MNQEYIPKGRAKTLARKMDKIDAASQKPAKKKWIQNRMLRKMLSNRLSVIGLVIFLVILFSSILQNMWHSWLPHMIP